MVGDLLQLIKRTNQTLNKAYKPRKNCKCTSCKKIRENSCKNSNKCGREARKLLSQLRDEWNLLSIGDLEEGQINEGIRDTINDEGSIIFDKYMHKGTSLRDSFRVFTKPRASDTINQSTLHSTVNQKCKPRPVRWIQAYTNGLCLKNGFKNATAGAGV